MTETSFSAGILSIYNRGGLALIDRFVRLLSKSLFLETAQFGEGKKEGEQDSLLRNCTNDLGLIITETKWS